MSGDIVRRLREGTFGTDECKTDRVINSHMSAAADEIERLRAEVERLTRERDEALDALDTLLMHGHPFGADNASMIVPRIEWEAVEIKLRALAKTETKE